MTEMRITYQGGLHCEAVHGPSSAKLLTDAPTDNMGKGEAFSPTDLVATALATCVLTVMGAVSDRHGLDIAGAQARVTKEMVAQPVRRIGRLAVEITVPRSFSPEEQRRIENAAHACPVGRSLHPDVRVDLVFHWGQS